MKYIIILLFEKIISDFALDEKHLRMLNALSEDQSHLRISLIPNLAESLHEAAKMKSFLPYLKSENLLGRT